MAARTCWPLWPFRSFPVFSCSPGGFSVKRFLVSYRGYSLELCLATTCVCLSVCLVEGKIPTPSCESCQVFISGSHVDKGLWPPGRSHWEESQIGEGCFKVGGWPVLRVHKGSGELGVKVPGCQGHSVPPIRTELFQELQKPLSVPWRGKVKCPSPVAGHSCELTWGRSELLPLYPMLPSFSQTKLQF